MLRPSNDFKGLRLLATDGEVGELQDFVVDVSTWEVRYAVVRVGSFLRRKQVLISTAVMEAPNWEKEVIPVPHTVAQINAAPTLRDIPPITREMEWRLHQHFSWVPYWAPGADGEPSVLPQAAGMGDMLDPAQAENPTLYLLTDMVDFDIVARGKVVGMLRDAIFNLNSWHTDWIVVERSVWKGGTLLPTEWVASVEWGDSAVLVDVPSEAVSSAPPYIEDWSRADIAAEYVEAVFRHYQQWTQDVSDRG